MKCTDENVDLNQIHKYFSVAGWEALLHADDKVTQEGVRYVTGMLTVVCYVCLDWFHDMCGHQYST